MRTARTPRRATAPPFPGTDTSTPCRPQHKLGARHTHTPRRDTCRSTTPHTRAPTAGPDAPLRCHSPPPPRRRHVRPPRPPGERGANNRLLLGRSPRPQEPQTSRPASRPLSPPPAGARARGVAAPPRRSPPTPRPPRTAGAGAVGVDSLPRSRTGRQGTLPSPHPIVCKQTRQTAEAPALSDPQCLPPSDTSLMGGGEGRERGRHGVGTQRPPHCSPSALPPPPPGSPPGLANRRWLGLGARTLTPGA